MSIFSYEDFENTFLSEQYDFQKSHGYLKEAKNIVINKKDKFDIFLSHSYKDRDIIPRLKKALEDMKYTVYVDWITDRLLNRKNVNTKTAEILQTRMKQSSCLLYATSENSADSKWMPWELGYFDGLKDKRVAILPIKTQNNSFSDNFIGQEYLGLYCWVVKDRIHYTNFNPPYRDDLFIKCSSSDTKKGIRNWMKYYE